MRQIRSLMFKRWPLQLHYFPISHISSSSFDLHNSKCHLNWILRRQIASRWSTIFPLESRRSTRWLIQQRVTVTNHVQTGRRLHVRLLRQRRRTRFSSYQVFFLVARSVGLFARWRGSQTGDLIDP